MAVRMCLARVRPTVPNTGTCRKTCQDAYGRKAVFVRYLRVEVLEERQRPRTSTQEAPVPYKRLIAPRLTSPRLSGRPQPFTHPHHHCDPLPRYHLPPRFLAPPPYLGANIQATGHVRVVVPCARVAWLEYTVE
ncbi:hypothetical protein M427DRAFT_326124 [Gonapodya prolifera JEL478]|uniref:Uncharacterized protein n=1 Tax=Gonapodya prolifera (strain JEL478) TaxID=1344416 RepID=A0A139AEM9_GONPJ|nr:hypothetical protein M427DRAFT_326124 [Gonapodya prolifera JEL478]|eukprot:KXS15200.1 hypothetical protein M427DRAFT_326124 [Gonapodya prolifera JEL478]